MSHSEWNPEDYAKHARFVSDLGVAALDLLAPKPGENILDLGCGDGALTIKLVEAGSHVVGVDSSLEMVQAAQSIGINARQIDGMYLSFNEEFDAVFTNAALHWMSRPEAVVRGVWKALKSDGRFVGEFGGYGNVASITSALEENLDIRGISPPHPWYFPRPEEFRLLLENSGFKVDRLNLIPRPTVIPGDLSAWLETLAGPYLNPLSPAERAEFITTVVDDLRPVLWGSPGVWTVDYVRLRFRAVKTRE